MARPQSKGLWLIGGAGAAVVIAVAGWFGAISPQLSSTSSLQAQTQSAQDENLALQSKISKLRRESATLPLLTSELRNLLAALPSDSGLPQFTRQVTAQAARQGVGLTSITVGSISAANGKSTVGGSGTSAADSNVFSIPVTLVSTGAATNQLAFLKAIQVDGPRRALVTSTQLTPSSGGNSKLPAGASITLTTQLSVFSAPLTPKQQAQFEKLLDGNIAN